MRRLLAFFILVLLWALTVPVQAQITTPYTFTAGTVANPDEVNSNFAKFSDALNRTGGTMTGTLTARAIVAAANNTYDIGASGTRFANVYSVLGNFSGTLTATTFSGSGASLTSVPAAQLAGVCCGAATNVALLNAVNTFTAAGSHTFSAASAAAGANLVTVRNTTATGYGALTAGNDTSASLSALYGMGSTYASSGPFLASSSVLYAEGSGGLSVVAAHASGAIRFYSGGTVNTMSLSSAGVLTVAGSGTGTVISTTTGTFNSNSTGAVNGSFVDGYKVTGYDALGYDGSAGLVLGGYRGSTWTSLKIYTAGVLRWGINSAGDWTGGSSGHIVDSLGTPSYSADKFNASSTIAGTDYAMYLDTFTPNDGQAVINFGHTFSTAPVCVAQSDDYSTGLGVATTTTQLTIVTDPTFRHFIHVICRGY